MKIGDGHWQISAVGTRCETLTYFMVEANGKDWGGAQPIHLLFFHDGQYLGTANDRAYPYSDLVETWDTGVTVSYRWRLPGDDPTAPTGGPANVTYQWNGSSIVHSAALPPEVTGQ